MTLSMTRTYELANSPPPAMLWDDYARLVATEWAALLNSPEADRESCIQAFLEEHPCMVPGAQSMSGPSGHAAFPSALIRQPKLPGFTTKIPDFMWIASDSMTTYAVVIEIESPRKRWFRRDGIQTAEFTQAHDQLADWRMWFEHSHNREAFIAHYHPSARPYRQFVIQYVLIYGRRSEFEEAPELSSKRRFLQRNDEYFMTFDRLHPVATSRDYLTVESTRSGYRAVSVPATLQIGPVNAEELSIISGKELAVERSRFMSDERKAFLKERFAYWDRWAKAGANGLMNLGDWE